MNPLSRELTINHQNRTSHSRPLWTAGTQYRCAVVNPRESYLVAADRAAELLASSQVAAKWAEPSALDRMTVRGLAGHLAFQVFAVANLLGEPNFDEPTLTIDQHYERVDWIGADLDHEFNAAIRETGERDAADGPEELAGRVRSAVEQLRTALPDAPAQSVRRPTGLLSLEDFLVSRILEIVIHVDDLAVSVEVDTPEFPGDLVELVVDRLSRIALRRHGSTNVVRALARAERAPASIAAL
jgi:hypothetical protein